MHKENALHIMQHSGHGKIYSEFKSSVQCTVCMKHIAAYGSSVNLTRLAFYVMIIGPGCVHGPMHTHTQLLGDDDDHNNYDGDHVFIAIIRNNLSFLCHPSFLSMEFQTSIVRRQN